MKKKDFWDGGGVQSRDVLLLDIPGTIMAYPETESFWALYGIHVVSTSLLSPILHVHSFPFTTLTHS